MKKLRNIIIEVYDSGKLPKGITLYDFRVIEVIYEDLLHKRQSEFINEEIKPLLERSGLKVKEKGVGWVVFR